MLKQNLINSGYFIDNIYLDRYIELLEKPFSFTGYFEIHHIIPVSFYNLKNKYNYRKAQQIAEQDFNNKKIKLSFADHCLAHWLIYKCCTKQFKIKARKAFLRVSYFIDSKQALEQNNLSIEVLSSGQEAKEYDMQNKPHEKVFTEEELKQHHYIKNKKWQEEHKEYVNERSKKGRQQNPEKIKQGNNSENAKACRERYLNANKQYMKDYYKKHKEQLDTKNKNGYIKNKSKYQTEEYKLKKHLYYLRKKQGK